MAAKFLERLAVPGIAAAAVIGAAFAATTDGNELAYEQSRSSLDAADAAIWAGKEFERADVNADGMVDAAEFGALAIVTAELAHLNGFVNVDEQTVDLPIEAPAAIASSQRARVSAIASRDFYMAAGNDNMVSRTEFINQRLERFLAADINRNGELSKRELTIFAVAQARILPAGA